MSYVAEPYFEVAEQLLTGLTGGVARETHRFFAAANAFRFEHEDAVAETTSVIGQANGVFRAFAQGIDFAVSEAGELTFLAAEDNPLSPAQGAAWPDEATEFYVSYYRANADPLITDRNVGSVTRTLGEAFARELTVLRKQLELVYDSAYVDTAEGSDLDRVVGLLAISRRRRGYASGKVRFFRDTPASADIFIPDGTRVSTALNPPASFATTAPKVLRRGQLAVEADIRAEAPGAAGVVGEKTITIIDRSILGISGVENAAPTVFGGAGGPIQNCVPGEESHRTRGARHAAPMHALTGCGLRRRHQIVEIWRRRPGVVQVRGARSQATLRRSSSGDLARAAGSFGTILRSLPLPKNTLYRPATKGKPTRHRVRGSSCRSSDNRVSGNPRLAGRRDELEAAMRYVPRRGPAIGGVLVYNRIVADLLGIAGVLDVILLVTPKAGSGDKGKRNLLVPAGRRATLAEADVTVRFAGAPVQFDFLAKVALKAPAAIADAQAEIKDRLVEFFARQPKEIAASGLMAALAGGDRYTLVASDLSWTAEYEEAGLVIREDGGMSASTALGDTDRALLRDVKVQEKAG
jgi:hypothetical protein